MCDGFVECHARPAGDDRSRFPLDGTDPLAGRTGERLGEALGVLAGEVFDGPFGQSGGGGRSDLFHLVEVDVESGTGLAVDASPNDFAPLFGEGFDGLEILGCRFACGHGASCHALGANTGGGFVTLLYPIKT